VIGRVEKILRPLLHLAGGSDICEVHAYELDALLGVGPSPEITVGGKVSVYRSSHWCILVYRSSHWCILVYRSSHWCILVYRSSHWCIRVYRSSPTYTRHAIARSRRAQATGRSNQNQWLLYSTKQHLHVSSVDGQRYLIPRTMASNSSV
jgi:hypothetical protein